VSPKNISVEKAPALAKESLWNVDKRDVDTLSNPFGDLGSSLDLVETLAGFDRDLRRLIAYQAITLHIPRDGRLAPAFVAGDAFHRLASLEPRLGEGFLGTAAAGRRVMRNCRVEGLNGLASALLYPLESSAGLAGMLALYHSGSNAFSEQDFQIVASIAPKLTAAVENALKYERAARLAGVDPLTGSVSARALFERLDAALARARRSHGEVAVIQCEIQGLAECPPELSTDVFNRVAEALRGCCREYDFVARSGDDFILLLEGFERRGLERKHTQIQAAVEEAGVDAGLPLSAAMGAAFFPSDASDAEGLLSAASENLLAGAFRRSGNPYGTWRP
jgi:GGDEF domain-containing protein